MRNFPKMVIFLAAMFVTMGVTAAAPVERVLVDMTYLYDEHTNTYPLFKNFTMEVTMNGTLEDSDVWIQAEEIKSPTHMGTHMDAPSHFILGGLNIEQLQISDFIAPAAVINIASRAEQDPDAEVTVEDLLAWEETTGHSLDGTVVLQNSGWGKKWLNPTAYRGTPHHFDPSQLHFPGFSAEASRWLVDNRQIKGIGVDTISFDRGSSSDFASHRIILGHGLFGLENVANVDKIPIYGATLYILPMKIKGASGAPTRIIASYPKVLFDS